MEAHWGLPFVKEHREETLIYVVEVVESNVVKHLRRPVISGDPRVLLEAHLGLSVCQRTLRGDAAL